MVRIVRRLPSTNGAFSAPVTKAYFPKMSRIKEPLIPGKIIAQIAIAPDKNIKGIELGVVTGIKETQK